MAITSVFHDEILTLLVPMETRMNTLLT